MKIQSAMLASQIVDLDEYAKNIPTLNYQYLLTWSKAIQGIEHSQHIRKKNKFNVPQCFIRGQNPPNRNGTHDRAGLKEFGVHRTIQG